MINRNNLADVTLVLVFKRPLLGQGKQRVAATLGGVAALALAEALLDCALEDLAAWPGPVVLAPASEDDADWARALLDTRFTRNGEVATASQGTGNLGERIMRIDRTLRARVAQALPILYMGSDAPMLADEHFASAVAQLDRHDVALNLAEDGGVVLMGSSTPWPDLESLPWSSADLGNALQQQCRAAGLTVGWGLPGYDIDQAQDLQRLSGDLARDVRPARQRLHDTLSRLLASSKTHTISVDSASLSLVEGG